MSDLEPEQADAVALLQSHLRGDEQAVNAMVDMVGVYELFAVTVGFVVDEVIGRDTLERLLADWQERRLS